MSKQIRSHYEKGASLAEIAIWLGTSSYLARKALVEAGATIRPRGRMVKLDRRSILRDYRLGMGVPKLAKLWGVTPGMIYQVLGGTAR